MSCRKSHAGADAVIVNTCGFLDSAKTGVAGGDRRGDGRERKSDRHRLHGGRAGADPRRPIPNVAAITGPQAYESVMAAVRAAAPAPHDPSST